MPEFIGFMVERVHDTERAVNSLYRMQRKMHKDSRVMKSVVIALVICQGIERVKQDAKIQQLEMRIHQLEMTNEAEGD